MKKLLSVLAALALVGTLAFAQEAEAAESGKSATISFQNEMKTPVIDVNFGDDGVSASFPYIYEDMQVNVESQYVDLEVKARVFFNPTGWVLKENIPESYWNGFMYDPDHTYADINFKPGYGIELGFGHQAWIPGSYFVIEDDNVVMGNIGSDGFTLGYTGVPGLHIAASFDINNQILSFITKEQYKYVFNTGFGVWYEFTADGSEDPFFTIGASYKFSRGNEAILVDNAHHAGIYVSAHPIEGLDFYAGYTYNAPEDDLFIASEMGAVNFSMSYEHDCGFYCAVDYNSDFEDALYAGLCFGYNINDNWATEVTTTAEAKYSDFANGEFCVNPWAIWTINEKHSLAFGPEFYFAEGGFTDLTFPVKWVYKF